MAQSPSPMRSPRRAIAAVTPIASTSAPSVHPLADADGIGRIMAAAKALADRHAGWAADMPRDVADLWGLHHRAGPCKRHGAVRALRLADR